MPVPTAVGHGWGGEVRDPGRRRRGRLCRERNHDADKRRALSKGTSRLDSGCALGVDTTPVTLSLFFLRGDFCFHNLVNLTSLRFLHSKVAICPL